MENTIKTLVHFQEAKPKLDEPKVHETFLHHTFYYLIIGSIISQSIGMKNKTLKFTFTHALLGGTES